nr:YolD-like family protein [Bacillus halotolerans]
MRRKSNGRVRPAHILRYRIQLSVWYDGFTSDITGHIHYVDPITHELRIEVKPGEFERVAFDSVVGVKVKN